MLVREFVIQPGQTIKKGRPIFGRVHCPVCRAKVLTQPVFLRAKGVVKHYVANEREHLIGTLERLLEALV